MTNKVLALVIVVVVGLFTFYGYVTLDPDFGWHLKMGQLIITSGIPKTDSFSYTMPSFPFIDHEWASNVILFRLYTLIGKIGLAFIFALLSILAFLFTLSKKDLNFSLIPLLLSSVVLLPFSGIRPQTETWVLLAIFLKILNNQKLWQKWRWGLPVFFTVWSNLHGGFTIGIVSLILFNLVLIWENRKAQFINWLITLLSIVATFINPYGFRVWEEVWRTVSDTNLRWSVAEWYPFLLFRIDFAFLLLLAFSLVFILKLRNHFTVFEKLLYGFLLVAGISSQRHVPLWLIATLPILTKSLRLIYEETHNNKVKERRLKKVTKILIISTVIIILLQTISILQEKELMSEDTYYPKNTLGFLRTLPKNSRIFAPYDWGGFLIWNLPEKKVFIDGRMPSWRWKTPNSSESSDAFKAYNLALYDKNQTMGILNKYNVDFVLWYKKPQKELGKGIKIIDEMENLYNQLTKKGEYLELPTNLKNNGWKEIYQDSVSVIYQK